ncbi:hypothetical protein C8R47DRAFT_1203181 [Mycena vitilis]|nr:hypothetical protein C8R47DRAFT_1203181 [Mycena vitilis]
MARPRLLPPSPQTQAHGSLTFKPPPLDGSLTIAQMYDWHFQNTPHHRLFVYPKEDGSTRTIYWPEAVSAAYTGAKILRDRFGWIAGKSEVPVVGILASSDTIPFFILFTSCLRANYIPFPISPRNSPLAVAHLISQAKVSHVLIGHEAAMVQLVESAVALLKKKYTTPAVPDVSYVPLFYDLFSPAAQAAPEDLPYEYTGPDTIAFISHSSGSTAFPKPIYWTNQKTIESALIPWFGERDLTDQIVSLHSMPMYHGMGILQTFWTASLDLSIMLAISYISSKATSGYLISAFEPTSPPTLPTPDGIFHSAKATESDIIFCVPSFIEAWARKPEYIQWLATRTGVLYGGGPLNKAVGDYITSQGVSIFQLYGSGEASILSPILSAEAGYDWEYFKFPKLVTPEMIPYGNNTFELVVVCNPFCTPAVLNTRVRGIDAYATSDLMVPHPTKPGYWKIYGRADDQIMHSTGEKVVFFYYRSTNPGPLETILNQDPHVLSCVMFGRERFQAGVIVDPKPPFVFDPSDPEKLAEFRNTIWPSVERMNGFAPQHSRLFKEMITVPKPGKPFTYTSKNTVRRQAVIAALNIAPITQWDAHSIRDFVRNAIHNVMANELGDDEDIFQHGCDSLQATWIRNCLLGALRNLAQLDTRGDARNFVYDHPTISRLAALVFAIASGQREEEDDATRDKSALMQQVVSKYVQNFPTHLGERPLPSPSAKVVLVTGTTGVLGCYLLQSLLADDSVLRVYSINRSSAQQQALRDRQASAFLGRGIDVGILDSPKLSLLSGDLSKSAYNLRAAVYEEMQQTVTHIIHTAWPVDFNLTLRSFEPNINGLRNLVDFSLASPFIEPARLIYASSIGIFQDSTENNIAETPANPEVVGPSGYQQSKWISEQILAKAAERSAAKPLIVRVGQLSGGINGAWKVQEWLPAVVQSAKFTGCLPDDNRDVAWLPVQIAARAIIDMLEFTSSTQIVHLINPRPVSWSILAKVIADNFGVPVVPYAEWLAKLESASQIPETPKSFRAPRLMPFFRAQNGRTAAAEAFGFPKMVSTNAVTASQSLRFTNCQLGEKDVKEWLRYWRSVGLF